MIGIFGNLSLMEFRVHKLRLKISVEDLGNRLSMSCLAESPVQIMKSIPRDDGDEVEFESGSQLLEIQSREEVIR